VQYVSHQMYRACGLLCVFATLMLTTRSQAQDFFWTNPTGGSFIDSANWNPAGGPSGLNDVAHFDLGTLTRYTVTDVEGLHGALWIRSDTLDLNIPTGSIYQLITRSDAVFPALPDLSMAVGISASDTADVLLSGGGTLVTQIATIAIDPNATGIVTVDNDATWITRKLFVSDFGSGTLTIQNGGTVSTTDTTIGHRDGSTGVVTVDGADSSLDNINDLIVGHFGSGTLNIQNGASAFANSRGIIANLGSDATGVVTVDGSGSTWTTTQQLLVGSEGTGKLTIQNSGVVSNDDGIIGSSSTATGTVVVDGAGSTWVNNSNLQVGVLGSGTLNIQNSGAVTVDLLTSINNTSTLNLQDGALATGSLDNTAGGAFNHTGGTVTIEGGSFDPNASGDYAIDGIDHPHVVLDGATFQVGSDGSANLQVGDVASGTLIVQNGSTVSVRNSTIAVGSDSLGEVTIDGPNTTWTSKGATIVGLSGSGSLTVQKGGKVIGATDSQFSGSIGGIVGYNPGSNGIITVAGDNSDLKLSGYIRIGHAGSGELTIQNGGTVSNTWGAIATDPGATGIATIDGPGSTWESAYALDVGSGGTGTVSVVNGGSLVTGFQPVASTQSNIGRFPGSTGTVTVDGVGSEWIEHALLNVGGQGNGTLYIKNGGKTTSHYGLVGSSGGSVGTVIVEGDGSKWHNLNPLSGAVTLRVGSSGTGTLIIRDGGEVLADKFTNIGDRIGSIGKVMVDGSSSVLQLFDSLDVGRQGVGILDIRNGATVSNTFGNIGRFSGGRGEVIVSGSGSSWTNSRDLKVGIEGEGTVTIDDNGSVVVVATTTINHQGQLNLHSGSLTTRSLTNTSGVLNHKGGTLKIEDGTFSPGSGAYTIDGPGNPHLILDNATFKVASETLAQQLTIGDLALGELTVQNGSTVSSSSSIIAAGSGSIGEVTVDGLNSTWTSEKATTIGGSGSGELTIQNGAEVFSATSETAVGAFGGTVGSASGSDGLVTVDGVNSAWRISGVLRVGQAGSGKLQIQNGGTVSNTLSKIGSDPSGTGTVTVDGSGSSWDNPNGLSVGDNGSGTVSILNGGMLISGRSDLNPSSSIGQRSSATGVVNIDGVNSTWIDYGSVGVGSEGVGALNIHNGGSSTHRVGYVGSSEGSSGTVTVDGSGSQWRLNSSLQIGRQGSGSLNIQNGGEVVVGTFGSTLGYFSGSTGTVTVDGALSAWNNDNYLEVGKEGDGILNVKNGGSVTVTGKTIVNSTSKIDLASNGSLTTGSLINTEGGVLNHTGGTLTINGGEMQTEGQSYVINGDDNPHIVLNNADFVVGDFLYPTLTVANTAAGSLTIQNGSIVSDNTAYVGNGADSIGVVTVEGPGSKWINTSQLAIGYSGNGTLNVLNGGVVTTEASSGILGVSPGSVGVATIDGPGSTWTLDVPLLVGISGEATMSIQNGGTVTSPHHSAIAASFNATGAVTVDGPGSTWTNHGELYIGGGGQGILNIRNNATVTIDGLNFNGETAEVFIAGTHFGGGLGGMLNIDSGGALNAVGNIKFWQTAVVNLDGGFLTAGSIDNTLGGTFNHTGGTLTIKGGSFLPGNGNYIIDGSGNPHVVLDAATLDIPVNTGLIVGDENSGALTIRNGGMVGGDGFAIIGLENGAKGEVLVSGSDSNWIINNLFSVGTRGKGALTITDSGQVTSRSTAIGSAAGSMGDVVVNEAGSVWDVDGFIEVGGRGTGSLMIEEGGHVNSLNGYVGFSPDAFGDVTVRGIGSRWSSVGDIYIGGNEVTPGGTGQLSIDLGGDVSIGTTLKIWDGGTVNLISGSLTATSLNNTTGGSFNHTGGTLTLNSGVFNPGSGDYAIDGPNSPHVILNDTFFSLKDIFFSIGSRNLRVGVFDSGELTIQNGARVVNHRGILGDMAGSTGTATVEGPGSTWENNDVLLVGSEGSGTLSILNGAIVSSNQGIVGGPIIGNPTGIGVVTVDGAGSKWINTTSLSIGFLGVGSLVIQNGGEVDSGASGSIASLSGSEGHVIVEGANSILKASGILTVGNAGKGTLDIRNGGMVSNGITNIGSYPDSVSVATVDGPASTWKMTGHLNVGHQGSGDLEILNGGTVSTLYSHIGVIATGIGTVIVDGQGSTWDNKASLFAGHTGTANVSIINGGTLLTGSEFTPTSSHIGFNSGSKGTVTVDGIGSTWNNFGNDLFVGFNGTGTLNILNGAAFSSVGTVSINNNSTINLLNGALTTGSLILVGGTFNHTGGLLAVNGGQFSPGLDDYVIDGPGDPHVLLFNAEMKVATDGSGDLSVGEFEFGHMTVLGGASVINHVGYIGREAGSSGVVTVDGSDSEWINNEGLLIGYGGDGILEILNGGLVVTNSLSSSFGVLSDSVGTVRVDGAGSTWISPNAFYVGLRSSGFLAIQNGGKVISGSGRLGVFTNATANAAGVVTVDGPGSTWVNQSELVVGGEGTGVLKITNGGRVTMEEVAQVVIGLESGSDGIVRVDGPGSTLNSPADFANVLTIGHRGAGALSIQNGGEVLFDRGEIAYDNGSTGTVIIDGPGSIWGSPGGVGIVVGRSGSGSLKIQNGGVISGSNGGAGIRIADNASATGAVIVDGPGSTIPNANITVGVSGFGTLDIQNGGVVVSGGRIGQDEDGVGEATVDGPDSSWQVFSGLVVGVDGSGLLTVTNGGSVSVDDSGFGVEIGKYFGATGEVVVDGSYSTLDIDRYLFVGVIGSGTLTVQNGGAVTNQNSWIGSTYGDSTVTVDGLDSSWTNTGDMENNNGELMITNGGVVSNVNAFVGLDSDLDSEVTLLDSNSTWITESNLYLGGNALTAIGDTELVVNFGSTVSVGNTLKVWDTATVLLNGGTIIAGNLDIDPGAPFIFNFGTLGVTGDYNFDSSSLIPNRTLSNGLALQVGGSLMLSAPLRIDGGELSAGSISNVDLLDFDRGTLGLTGGDLIVSDTGLFGPTRTLNSDQTLNVTTHVQIASDGRLQLNGGHLNAAQVNNQGVIQGDGRIGARLNNTGEVRVNSTDQILFTGSGNTNDGKINLLGGTIEFSRELINSSSGSINGRGVLIVSDGLTHQGQMNLSGGLTDVYGNVTITEGASVIVTSGAVATFYDDVKHNGDEIRTSANSTTTFFGTVSGIGSFTGIGTVNFEGIYSPGNSPGVVSHEGDVRLGSASTLVMELGGMQVGVDYDNLVIGGDLYAAGVLYVELLNNYRPQLGDTFDLLDFGSLSGDFDAIHLPTLYHGLFFDTTTLLTTGSISVVPEPASIAMLALALLLVSSSRYRRLG